MESSEHLRVMVRMKEPAFVLFHDPAIPPETVCASVVRWLDKLATVAHLRSDHITADEGAFIRDALLGGRVLLLIAPDAKKLPAELLKAWECFCEDPQHTASNAGRGINFDPGDAQREVGTLGLILPNDYTGRRPRAQCVIRIATRDELGEPALPPLEMRTIGRAAVSLSMKALCFLHHRDPEAAQHYDSIKQIMHGRRPFTWHDLQRVLRQQPDEDMLCTLESFGAQGRVSAEQLDVAAEAIAFLREERREEERLGGRGLAPSIYHLLWIYGFLEARDRVFRGQRNSRWRQETTLLRPEPDGMPASLDTIVERLHWTQFFLDALTTREQEIIGRTLDDDERLAIAQHYGMPTPLLDYTRSLAIAAFFATGAGDASKLRADDIGVIYFVAPNDPVVAPACVAPAGLDLAEAAGLRLGRLSTIEPVLPDTENRIARQKGVFIEGFDSRHLQRLSLGVLYFRQQPGEAFQDPRLGITRELLLSPDAKLQQLADSVAPKPTKLSKRLTAARLPGDDLFGALGLSLPGNLYKGQRFLDQVMAAAEEVEPGFWPALKAILERHIDEAGIAARTADVSAPGQLVTNQDVDGISYILDDVDVSLEELAVLIGQERDALTKRLRKHRPVLGPDMEPTWVHERATLSSPTLKARIVLAVGVFIVGLEYLRTVRGPMAALYFDKAYIELSGASQA